MELNQENLYQKYIVENLSRNECACLFDCSETKIKKELHNYGIKKDLKQIAAVRAKNNIEKYGVKSPCQLKEIAQKVSDTKKAWTKEQKEHMVISLKNTMTEKYYVENASYLNSNYFKNIDKVERQALAKKSAATFKKNYTKDISLKRKQTCIKKYGVDDYNKSDMAKQRFLEKNPNYDIINSKELLTQKILELDSPTIYDICNVLGYSYSVVFKAIQNFNLNDMVKKAYSQTNVYWHDLILKELGVDMKYEGAIFLNKHSKVDLYDDVRKIAIDINPTATHNTQFNPFHPEHKSHIGTMYHFNRAKEAEAAGWLLYQIFDWDDEVKVIRQLKSIFGLNPKVYARKCEVRKIEKSVANSFFDRWHSQDRAESIVNYGIYYQDALVAVMSFGRARFNKMAQYELIRYAGSDINVVGGASKLLKAFIKDYNPKSILTYSDYAKGHGKVYEKIGFKFVGFAGLTALYAPLNKQGIAYKTQKASREYKKNGNGFASCKEYFNSKNWYRINDANNKIWIWESSGYNSEN